MKFGHYIRNCRESQGLSLRAFCKLHHLDPANYSRLERGVARPPANRVDLYEVARRLKLDGQNYAFLIHLAAIDHATYWFCRITALLDFHYEEKA